MPRKPKERKIAKFSEEQMKKAVTFVSEGGSIRQAAEKFKVSKSTLQRYVTKSASSGPENIRMEPNYSVNSVFSKEEETSLKEYLSLCARTAYGPTSKLAKDLDYELAIANKKKVPDSWRASNSAGGDWLRAFLKRNKLSICKPEGCSLSRMTSFNKHNVSGFFENLKDIVRNNPALMDPSRIFNLDKTGTTTVQNPKKVIADKGVKQLSSCTSAERGTLVTTCAIICATGTFLQPAMILPRKHFKQHMLTGAPPGTLSLATLSGLMSSELFPEVLQHFITHSHSSKENPSLLIFDNLEAHVSIEVVEKARVSGVTILTLPPHCSHKMQPLDKTVFYSFKAAYNAACDVWLLNHPGIPLTIYQVAELVNTAFDASFTPKNIKSGFARTGIYPLDENVFTDADFIKSTVTDRPPPNMETVQEKDGELPTTADDEVAEFEAPISSLSSPSRTSSFAVTPEALRGYPKASERKTQRKQIRRKKSTIITSSPVKEDLTRKKEEKEAKKGKKRIFAYSGSDSFAEDNFEFEGGKDDSDEDSDIVGSGSEHENIEEKDFFEEDANPELNSWVLVEYEGKKNKLFYVGQVVEKRGDEIVVNFLKKGKKHFVFPMAKDEASVKIRKVRKILPEPVIRRGYYTFTVTFPASLNLV